MRHDVELKLLELTKRRHTMAVRELARELNIEPEMAKEKLESLASGGFLTLGQDELELDPVQRLLLADHLIRIGRDPQKVARLLEWQEFENFAIHVLRENGFQSTRHLVFKTKVGRREIDVLGWSETFLFAIDCKHWAKGLHPGRVRIAVQAQLERTEALAEKPELLSRLGVASPERRRITPVLLTLGEPRESFVHGVPVVSVAKLISFLYGVSPIDPNLRSVRVKSGVQQHLFAVKPKA